MAVDTRPLPQLAEEDRDLVVDVVVEALQPRLRELTRDSLRSRVQSALDEMGEVRVTTYLPILVERKVRDGLRRESSDESIRLPA